MAAQDNIYLELPEKPKNEVSTNHRNLPNPPVGAGVSDIYLKPPQRRSIVQRLSFRSKSGDLNKHRLLCIIGAIAGLFFVGLTVGLITKWTCDTNDDGIYLFLISYNDLFEKILYTSLFINNFSKRFQK